MFEEHRFIYVCQEWYLLFMLFYAGSIKNYV